MTHNVPQCTDELNIVTDMSASALNLSADEEGMLVRLTRPLEVEERAELVRSWRGHRPADDRRPRLQYVEDTQQAEASGKPSSGFLYVPVLSAPGTSFVTFRFDVLPALNEALRLCAQPQ